MFSLLLPAVRQYGMKFAFFVRFFWLQIYLGDGGTDRREILHDGTYMSRMCRLPFEEVPPVIPKSEIFPPPYGGYRVLLTHLFSL